MKREIKFRAWSRTGEWDEEGEKRQFEMIGADNLAFYCADLLKNLLKDSDDDFYIMQFTGLKDKNGKEIYEGDIYLDEKHRYRIIKYSEVRSCFDTILASDERLGNPLHFENRSEIKIIGNIYENPELLGKDQTNA